MKEQGLLCISWLAVSAGASEPTCQVDRLAPALHIRRALRGAAAPLAAAAHVAVIHPNRNAQASSAAVVPVIQRRHKFPAALGGLRVDEWVGGGTHRLSNLEGSHELNPAAWLMGSRRCPLRDAHWMLVLLPPAPWGGRYTFCPSRTMHSLLPQPQYTCSTVILVG
jgi:hypothetical protein